MQFTTRSEADTMNFARRLSPMLRPGDTVLLYGDLGAGKSVLARGIARGLGVEGPMPSPTFTLMQPYEGRIPFYHFDLYRLADPEEFYEAGLDEYAFGEGAAVIEWPECADLAPDFCFEADIRRAAEHGELKVFLQPKYEITTGHVIGAEALVRWEHPERGMLTPNKFVPTCEENGFICEIDFFVLEEVCRKMREWKEEGKKLVKVSTNFSRRHLEEVDFVDRLIRTVERYGLKPSDLEIELTESLAYDEMGTLLSVMRQIKEAGFGLSMDDFGSGYSSLSLLREMPVDVLKLDKGFLDGCHEGASANRDKRIVYHIISMAKDLNISVLAEGVETLQQMEFLKASHCDMIQGYYYAKPMPSKCFGDYLEAIA